MKKLFIVSALVLFAGTVSASTYVESNTNTELSKNDDDKKKKKKKKKACSKTTTKSCCSKAKTCTKKD